MANVCRIFDEDKLIENKGDEDEQKGKKMITIKIVGVQLEQVKQLSYLGSTIAKATSR